MDIKLNIKLRAYTRGIIPDTSNFIQEAPDDGEAYVRMNKSWVNIKDIITDQIIEVAENSGLTLTQKEENSNTYILSTNEVVCEDLPNVLQENVTYYIPDDVLNVNNVDDSDDINENGNDLNQFE